MVALFQVEGSVPDVVHVTFLLFFYCSSEIVETYVCVQTKFCKMKFQTFVSITLTVPYTYMMGLVIFTPFSLHLVTLLSKSACYFHVSLCATHWVQLEFLS